MSFNPNLGGLFRGSFCGRREGELPPFLKLVRIILQNYNLVRKYTHIFSCKKYTFQYPEFPNFADLSILFAKNQRFLAKIAPLLKAIV